jgi:hypothetical protein
MTVRGRERGRFKNEGRRERRVIRMSRGESEL